jgi:phosphoribosyl-ATP pyrophosphohydrolase
LEIQYSSLHSRVPLPGLSKVLDLEALSEYKDVAWTVSLVRAGISVIAFHVGEDAEELLEAATEEARRNILRAKHKAEEVV